MIKRENYDNHDVTKLLQQSMTLEILVTRSNSVNKIGVKTRAATRRNRVSKIGVITQDIEMHQDPIPYTM